MTQKKPSKPTASTLCKELADLLDPPEIKLLPSQWAERHRMLAADRPWRFDRYPFQRAIHDDLSRRIVVAKGSQVGVTEIALNRAFHAVHSLRVSVLYVFPTIGDAHAFSKSRVDTSIRECPELTRLFTDVHNVGQKSAGGVDLLFRGSNSESGLEVVPVGMLVLDEYDLMTEKNIPRARERLTGHARKIEVDVGKPTVPGYGIWEEYLKTDRRRWTVPCQHCGRRQALDFEKNLEWREGKPGSARYKCAECGHFWTEAERLESIAKGEWVAERRDGDIPGYHISQLYSPTMTAEEIVGDWFICVQGQDEPRKQMHYNSKRGLPYQAEGTRLSLAQVQACVGSYVSANQAACATMGIDVTPDGQHYAEIAEWRSGRKRVLALRRPTWNDLDGLMAQYGVACCVIDANPERKDAREFCERWKDRAYMAFYPVGMKELYTCLEDKQVVNIARTEAIDRVLSGVKTRALEIPQGARWFGDYAAHLTAVGKSYERNKRTGQPVARYLDMGKPDHWLHAATYNGIAECIARTGTGSTQKVWAYAVG